MTWGFDLPRNQSLVINHCTVVIITDFGLEVSLSFMNAVMTCNQSSCNRGTNSCN